jgi:hypothetical protein
MDGFLYSGGWVIVVALVVFAVSIVWQLLLSLPERIHDYGVKNMTCPNCGSKKNILELGDTIQDAPYYTTESHDSDGYFYAIVKHMRETRNPYKFCFACQYKFDIKPPERLFFQRKSKYTSNHKPEMDDLVERLNSGDISPDEYFPT